MNIIPEDSTGPYTVDGGSIVDVQFREITPAPETYTTGGEFPSKAVYTDFVAFKKIPRLFRDVTITEKIDGTNAQIFITPDGQILAGKRSGYCTPEKDNFGFAAWVRDNKEELLKLGPGRHFGEWYGRGINRNYGLQDRRFALFHTNGILSKPDCVGVVPVLYHGLFSTGVVRDCVQRLIQDGSILVPGWMKPEGVVVFHEKAGQLFKVTVENDEQPKGVKSDN
jgi:hypothetical protein